MDVLLKTIKRIGAIQGLAFKEALRRRMILLLVICAVLFIGSGAGCAGACRGLQRQQLEAQRKSNIDRIHAMQLTEQEKQQRVDALEKEFSRVEKQEAKSLKSFLLLIIFSMIAFWLFMITGIFTPFLGMNDFEERTHIMILARPLRRWEYLAGKYLAIVSMLLLNLLILLISSFVLMYVFLDEPGWEILRGVAVFIENLLLFAALLFLLGLWLGRIPAVLAGIVIVGLGVIPAIYLMTGKVDTVDSQMSRLLIYGLGYGLPQFALNFFYALNQVLKGLQGIQQTGGFFKLGNNSGFHSLFINAGWLIASWAALVALFRRKEIN